MGVGAPSILFCDVVHKRLRPREHGFVYKMFYLSIPLKQIDALKLPILSLERFNLFSFCHEDHGYRDGRDCREWLNDQLIRFNLPHLTIEQFDGEWRLITLPRMLGYVFNPVSFWYAQRVNGELAAVIAEVNNTFGETHSYLLAHIDGRAIEPKEWIEGQKQFHVSPFLSVEGTYQFRFDIKEGRFAGFIDYYNADSEKTLITSMIGQEQPYKTVTLAKACLHIPFVTVRVIVLIHYQAFKLWLKKIHYRCKPEHSGRFFTRWPFK